MILAEYVYEALCARRKISTGSICQIYPANAAGDGGWSMGKCFMKEHSVARLPF